MSRLVRLGCLVLALAALPLVAGCGGCLRERLTAEEEAARREQEEKLKRLEEARKKREQKPPYEIGQFMTQPNNLSRLESGIKPGHWTSATVEVIANHEDLLGELATDPLELPGMPFRLGTSRPALLGKGQRKHLELLLYVPPYEPDGKRPQVVTRLRQRGGRDLASLSHPVTWLPDYQFYFVVLADTPDRYRFLEDLDSVRPPTAELVDTHLYYRVLLPPVDKRAPLASNPLCWTNVAYLLWDDVRPDVLSPEQQLALVDWLHWGGGLVISGPGSLDALRGSFLEPYLPAAGGDVWQLEPAVLAEMSERWTPAGQRPLSPIEPWSGQKLVLHPQAAPLVTVGDEPLVAERRVGRGRIVLSAFRLNQRELVEWKGLDNFVNSCLLRRPARRFSIDPDLHGLRVDWRDPHHDRLDPRLVSGVRYYTRDLEGTAGDYRSPAETQSQFNRNNDAAALAQVLGSQADPWLAPDPLPGSGVAGWNDGHELANRARAALRGGIVIPGASFIATVLGVYLLVLVPLNWAVFRAIGRVEWAWLAAPVVTLAFSLAVVRLAQLDVGFVRTKSEIGVVELQGGYPRAHVTRYTALYTSLSTTYDLRFHDATALAQPFPAHGEMLRGESFRTVNYHREPQVSADGEKSLVSLAGFDVRSNSQAMLHSEHMLDVGGGVSLERLPDGRLQVVNDTHLELKGAGVVGPQGKAWIGNLLPGAAAKLEFQPIESIEPIAADDQTAAPSQENPPAGIPAEAGLEAPGSGEPELAEYPPPDEPEIYDAIEVARPEGQTAMTVGEGEWPVVAQPAQPVQRVAAELWPAERNADPATSSTAGPEMLDLRPLLRLAEQAPLGEIRLIAWTDEPLAGLSIEPESSQARHANIVLVHLAYPPTPVEADVSSRAEIEVKLRTDEAGVFSEP